MTRRLLLLLLLFALLALLSVARCDESVPADAPAEQPRAGVDGWIAYDGKGVPTGSHVQMDLHTGGVIYKPPSGDGADAFKGEKPDLSNGIVTREMSATHFHRSALSVSDETTHGAEDTPQGATRKTQSDTPAPRTIEPQAKVVPDQQQIDEMTEQYWQRKFKKLDAESDSEIIRRKVKSLIELNNLARNDPASGLPCNSALADPMGLVFRKSALLAEIGHLTHHVDISVNFMKLKGYMELAQNLLSYMTFNPLYENLRNRLNIFNPLKPSAATDAAAPKKIFGSPCHQNGIDSELPALLYHNTLAIVTLNTLLSSARNNDYVKQIYLKEDMMTVLVDALQHASLVVRALPQELATTTITREQVRQQLERDIRADLERAHKADPANNPAPTAEMVTQHLDLMLLGDYSEDIIDLLVLPFSSQLYMLQGKLLSAMYTLYQYTPSNWGGNPVDANLPPPSREIRPANETEVPAIKHTFAAKRWHEVVFYTLEDVESHRDYLVDPIHYDNGVVGYDISRSEAQKTMLREKALVFLDYLIRDDPVFKGDRDLIRPFFFKPRQCFYIASHLIKDKYLSQVDLTNNALNAVYSIMFKIAEKYQIPVPAPETIHPLHEASVPLPDLPAGKSYWECFAPIQEIVSKYGLWEHLEHYYKTIHPRTEEHQIYQADSTLAHIKDLREIYNTLKDKAPQDQQQQPPSTQTQSKPDL